MANLRAFGINCTLKGGTAPSSTDLLVQQVLDELDTAGVEVMGPPVRVADLNIKPGVTSDEGDGDDWPALRERIMGADILVFGTPSGWTPSCPRPTTAAACRASARSPSSPWWATRTAPTTCPPSCTRRSATWASRFPPTPPPIGWARRWAAPTTRTSRRRPRACPAPRSRWRSTPPTSPPCSRRAATRRRADRPGPPSRHERRSATAATTPSTCSGVVTMLGPKRTYGVGYGAIETAYPAWRSVLTTP